MRQHRGAARAAVADGDSCCFNRPLRAPPADLRAWRPGYRGVASRLPSLVGRSQVAPRASAPGSVQCQRTQRRNPELAGGARGQPERRRFGSLCLEAAQNLC